MFQLKVKKVADIPHRNLILLPVFGFVTSSLDAAVNCGLYSVLLRCSFNTPVTRSLLGNVSAALCCIRIKTSASGFTVYIVLRIIHILTYQTSFFFFFTFNQSEYRHIPIEAVEKREAFIF